MQTFSAKEIGVFTVTAISLGTSKKPNPQTGKLANFVVLYYQDIACPTAGTKRRVLFDEDYPGLYANLKPFVIEGRKDDHEGEVVDVKAVRRSDLCKLTGDAFIDDDIEVMRNLLRMEGAMRVMMPLKKGTCIANDADGTVQTDKVTGKPRLVDAVEVFAQARTKTINDDGTITFDWRLDPAKERDRIEARFYRNAAPATASAPVTTAPSAVTTPQPETAPAAAEAPAGAAPAPF